MVYIFAACAVLSTLLGGVVAMRIRDGLHLVLGAAAGVLLGVACFDLLPEALDQSDQQVFGVPAVMLMAVGGFFTIHILERSLAIHQAHEGELHGSDAAARDDAAHGHSHGLQSVGLLAGAGLVLHSMLDGLGIGLGFAASSAVGVAVAIAVVAHDFADGFNTFTITSLYGNARKRAVALLIADALAPMVGVLLAQLIDLPPSAIGLYLGYFAGFLLYLATSDILPEAHAHHPSRLTLVCTVLGAGFIWVVVGLS